MTAIRVIIVDDHDIVREGLRSILEREPGIEVIGEASKGEDALELCRSLQPALALIDLKMPVMDGLECIRILNKEIPSVKVIVLSMYDKTDYLVEALDTHANGYVLKGSGMDELIFAIKKVAAGGSFISAEFMQTMVQKYKSVAGIPSSCESMVPLSEAEAQVLELIARGDTNMQIANKLFVSVRTVESRRKKLLEKTGSNNTATLIRFSVKNNLVK